MKVFRAVAVVKHPPAVIACLVRDRLGELVSLLEDVDIVEMVEREHLADGGLRQVNAWRAKTALPPALLAAVGGAIEWFDEAVWAADASACVFTIRPKFLEGAFECSGSVAYQPALGGKGTRATFDGVLDVRPGALGPAGLDHLIAGTVELVATNLVPKNLRRTLEAAAALLDRDGA